MHSGTVNYVAVVDGKAGGMPWTLDNLALKLAFGQRAAEVRAGLGKGIYLRATPNQQNRSSIMIDANRQSGSYHLAQGLLSTQKHRLVESMTELSPDLRATPRASRARLSAGSGYMWRSRDGNQRPASLEIGNARAFSL
jgi:hypothetical protein